MPLKPAALKRMRAKLLAPRDRWTAVRKYDLAMGVRNGWITTEEACAAHQLAPEEIADWQQKMDRRGLEGLRVSRRVG